MDDRTIIQEFLIESAEALGRMDQEMVQLERDPANQVLIGSVFRTLHTIKGTCGFLGFGRLEALAHASEDLLSEVRNGKRRLNPALTTVLLEGTDTIKEMLVSIEESGTEGPETEQPVLARLRAELEAEPRQGAQPEPDEAPRSRPVAAPPPKPAEPEAEQPVAQEPVPAESGPKEEKAAPMVEMPKAPEPAQTPESANGRTTQVTDSTLRVDVAVLDRLMNLVGELVLARNQVLQWNPALEDATLNAIRQRLNLITTELQEGVMKTRMQPIGVVWNKMPRVVRDLAAALDKEIELVMDGSETELDRTVVEAIKDPLTHIVRNSCDHGLEPAAKRRAAGKAATGQLMLRASHRSGQVQIEIADDGTGIDTERVRAKAIERGLMSAETAARLTEAEAMNLIFHAGLSTAQQVTSLSGRGVGMDVVKTSIERIGGTVELRSSRGQGTTVLIRIPLTLAIIPGLVVWCGGARFVIPQVSLEELVRLEGETARTSIEHVHRTPVLRRQGRLLPLVDLTGALGMQAERGDEIHVAVVHAGEQSFGLIVDAISDTEEIVVKPLHSRLKALAVYAGSTIMGDGQIALILDVAALAARCGLGEGGQAGGPAAKAAQSGVARSAFLLVRCGRLDRLALPLMEVARLEEIAPERVEHAGGAPVVQYRGTMLPLVALGGVLGEREPERGEQEPWRVVVVRRPEGTVGLVVDEILDAFEEEVAAPRGSERFGLLGSAVVGGRVTDFLDLEAIAGPAPGLERLSRVIEAAAQLEEVAR